MIILWCRYQRDIHIWSYGERIFTWSLSHRVIDDHSIIDLKDGIRFEVLTPCPAPPSELLGCTQNFWLHSALSALHSPSASFRESLELLATKVYLSPICHQLPDVFIRNLHLKHNGKYSLHKKQHNFYGLDETGFDAEIRLQTVRLNLTRCLLTTNDRRLQTEQFITKTE